MLHKLLTFGVCKLHMLAPRRPRPIALGATLEVLIHVVDRGLIVLHGCLIVALLVHDRADICQTDPLLAVIVVEIVVNVVSVRVGEESLGELLLVHIGRHGLRGEIYCPHYSIKGEVQFI